MMGLESAPQPQHDTSPIFEGFRRGYDPEQVDRFVADQQRRFDETLNRASEAERRLAAAVGQLRELHRRVAMLEEERTQPVQAQAQPLDTLGERVQRILQESWEGAAAIRQTAEDEAADIRQRTLAEANDIVGAARRKAKAIEDEIEKRRRAYLGRVEEERTKAVAQITFLHDQRKSVLGELVRMKEAIASTVEQVRPVETPQEQAPSPRSARPMATPSAMAPRKHATEREVEARRELEARSQRPRTVHDVAPKTMPVFHLDTAGTATESPDASVLVRNHRATVDQIDTRVSQQAAPSGDTHAVFDFDEE